MFAREGGVGGGGGEGGCSFLVALGGIYCNVRGLSMRGRFWAWGM